MFTQLATPIPLYVREKGSGYAIAVIDYGQEHDLIWVTIMDESGEICCVPNPKIRAAKNWRMGRSDRPERERRPPVAITDRTKLYAFQPDDIIAG